MGILYCMRGQTSSLVFCSRVLHIVIEPPRVYKVINIIDSKDISPQDHIFY